MADHTITQKVTTSGKAVESVRTITAADGGLVSQEFTIADAVTDQQVNIAIDVSQLKSIYILSTQNILLETNNAATPTDTINLLANVPYMWDASSYFTNKITADVTKMFFTNSSGATATVKIETLEDVTV
ncbi:MAG: hypothetical protein ACE5E6_09405 [Phycisphaerae bacterium]